MSVLQVPRLHKGRHSLADLDVPSTALVGSPSYPNRAQNPSGVTEALSSLSPLMSGSRHQLDGPQ